MKNKWKNPFHSLFSRISFRISIMAPISALISPTLLLISSLISFLIFAALVSILLLISAILSPISLLISLVVLAILAFVVAIYFLVKIFIVDTMPTHSFVSLVSSFTSRESTILLLWIKDFPQEFQFHPMVFMNINVSLFRATISWYFLMVLLFITFSYD